MGVAVFGVPVLMILAALTVTGEYRSGMIRTTFMAAPNRTLVLAAKATVAAAFSSFYAAVMVAASIVVAHCAPPNGGWSVGSRSTRRSPPLSVLPSAHSCGPRRAPSRCSCYGRWWPSPCSATCPTSAPGRPVPALRQRFRFIDVPWLYPYYAMPWGPLGSIVYFAGVAAVLFVAALVTSTAGTHDMSGTG